MSGARWAATVNRGIAGVHRPRGAYPALSEGSRGDLVVWAQEHLRGAGQAVPVTGYFGRKTRRAVKRFQRSKGVADDGRLGPDLACPASA